MQGLIDTRPKKNRWTVERKVGGEIMATSSHIQMLLYIRITKRIAKRSRQPFCFRHFRGRNYAKSKNLVIEGFLARSLRKLRYMVDC